MAKRQRRRAPARKSTSKRKGGRQQAPWWRRLPQAPGALRRWLRRTVLMLLLVFVVLPLGLILLYRVVPPPGTPLMLIRLAEGQSLEKQWASWEAVSPHLRRAVIASEDNLFCEHSGFDWESLEAAAKAYAAGERAGGGSTITMQTAKNLFLWPSRSIIRKGLEVPLTALLEMLWPKRRILEVYLNIAEWGPGLYGIEAAARHYFNRPAIDLTPRQASQLVAVLPNPLEWRPVPPSNYIARRAATIRTRIRQLGPLLDCVST